MNFIDIDNFVTSYLCKHIEIYEQLKNNVEYYRQVDMSKVRGKIFSDIQNDLEILEELKFYENILMMYKYQTSEIIKQFLVILKTPIKNDDLNYLKKIEKKKQKILCEYLNIVKSCIPYNICEKINLPSQLKIDSELIYCENCENINDFIKDNDTYICNKCFAEVIKMTYYNNKSFTNNSKCNYDRISHFKECLKQYQGKQNTFINPVIYSDLEKALEMNDILVKSLDKRERFKNVKKTHIMYFLKELGYTKHYDDYILIHKNLTGQDTNDISHLEQQLISDFEKISDKYSQLYSNERKNFINIQFILYKLLQKHNFPFDNEDFLSVIDRKMEREGICNDIFEELGWIRK